MKKSKSKKTHRWIAPTIVVVVFVLAIVGFFYMQNNASTIPANISITEAHQRFSDGAFLLDVREQSEWDVAHIAGSVLIPLGQLSTRIQELPTDQDILIICRSGNRSSQARNTLRTLGLKQTTSINGGINAWIAAGLPVVTGP